MTATWGATRAAPREVHLTYVNVQLQSRAVAARSEDGETRLASAEPVRFDVGPELSIDEFREMVVDHFAISPRKEVVLRWWDAVLENGHDFRHYRVSDGSRIDVFVKARPFSTLELIAAEQPLNRIRIQALDGTSVGLEGVTQETTPKQIKQILVEYKLMPGLAASNVDAARMCFSPLTPTLVPGKLPLLEDDQPIGGRAERVGARVNRWWQGCGAAAAGTAGARGGHAREVAAPGARTHYTRGQPAPTDRRARARSAIAGASVIDNDIFVLKFTPVAKDDKKGGKGKK